MPETQLNQTVLKRGALAAWLRPRTFLCLALLATVALLTWLPRVGVPADDRMGAGTVKAWGWNTAAASLESLVPGFSTEHPEIDVAITTSGASMQSRFLLSLASNVGAPDICQLQEREAEKFTASRRLADLTEFAAVYADDFAPAFWASGQYDGRTYAVPWDIGPCAVFYKRWVFERYGINPDDIETWNDFIAAGEHIYEASNGRTRMMPLSAGGLPDFFQILMQQAGGGVFDDQGRITIQNPGNAAALGVLRRLLDADITTPLEGPELLASFSGDSVACYPAAVWFKQQIQDYAAGTDGQWGVLRLPAIEPGGLRTSNLGGSMLVIPAQSLNIEAAWRFIEFTNCRVESQVDQYRNFALFPAYLPALEHPYFDEPDPFFGNQRIHRLFATDLEQLPPMVRTRDWSEAERYFRQTLSTWAQQRIPTDDFLATAAEALSRKVGREIVGPTAEVSP